MALLQKRIVSRCNQLGKPVHITRIVDTMVSTPRPTRAGARLAPPRRRPQPQRWACSAAAVCLLAPQSGA